MLNAKKNCIKNWARINISSKANNLVLLVNIVCKTNSLNWTQSVTDCLNRIGIGTQSRNIHKTSYKRMWDIFHQEAFLEISKDTSKLRTYGKTKQEQGSCGQSRAEQLL